MGGCVSKRDDSPKRMKDIKQRTAFKMVGYECGCLALPLKEEKQTQPIELPLKKIIYDIQIVNGIAEVSLSQTYVNTGDKFLELQYRFPISPNACIHKFTATFAKRRFQGVVKEKEVARVQYAEAVKMGKRTVLGEIDAQSSDVLTLQIGNLSPNEEVLIQISYVEELSLCLNTFYQFNFVPKLTPRYVNSIPPQDYLNSFRKKVKSVSGEFEWDFRLKVRASRKIVAFNSSTHALNLEAKNADSTELSLTLQKGEPFTKAFGFFYTTEQFQLPSYTLGHTDVGSSVILSFIPKFCNLALEDAEASALKDKGFEADMDDAKGEYIFLLDRSGSMRGQLIKKAKEALILFLKSLPIDTYFQVVSFGSNFQNMFKQPQRNSNEAIKTAIQKIEGIEANMGGTQIQSPLTNIFKSKAIEGYPKQIFLLTDGAVGNTKSVINLVKKHNKYARVHAIGIGNGVSQALIKGCAEKGKGQYIFIGGNEDPSEKIIDLLNSSLTPVISKVVLEYDKELVKSIVPNPQKMPYILKGEIVNFFVSFTQHLKKPTAISLTYTDSRNGLPFKSTIEVSPNSKSEPFVDKMTNYKTISMLEDAEADSGSVDEYLYFAKSVDKRQQIVSLSTRNNILSKYTAFICVEQELVDGRFEEVKGKGREKAQIVQIDRTQPQRDYKRMQRRSMKQSIYRPCLSIIECRLQKACISQPPGLPQSAQRFEMETVLKGISSSKNGNSRGRTIKQSISFDAKEQSIDEFINQIHNISYNEKQFRPTQPLKKQSSFSIKEIVKMQLFEGNWDNEAIITHIFEGRVDVASFEDKHAAITYLIVIWIEKYHPEKEYTMIIKKARNWLKKQKRYSEFPNLFDSYLM